MPFKLYDWARELVALYESGAVNQFILYGNVNDRIPSPSPGGNFRAAGLRDYINTVLMEPFDVVLSYDVGNGIRVDKGGEIFQKWTGAIRLSDISRTPRQAVEALTHYFRYTANLARLGQQSPQVGCVVDAAELIAPRAEGSLSHDINSTVILIREWASDTLLKDHSIATFLVTENISDIHPLVSGNGQCAKIKLPLPDAKTIEAIVQNTADGETLGQYAEKPAGLAAQLVGATVSSVERMLKTAKYNKAPLTPEVIVSRKKRMVEEEYGGLIGFVESGKSLDYIYGHQRIKQWLRQDMALWHNDDLEAMPMGYLLCGPVGTGKTFFVECLAGEAGVPIVRMKNFRDKWVGSTEGNLEKIFRLIQALGRCIVFVDEADQALGRRVTSSGDSGVSGRVYSMIAEQMSDTDNRGRVLWILASSRPDLIEVDLKRPGRIDVKFPLFPTMGPKEGFTLIQALCGRLGIGVRDELFEELMPLVPEMLTPGAAEALAVKVYRLSKTTGQSPVEALRSCLRNYLLPVPREVLEYQIGLAVREASDIEFVPEKLRSIYLPGGG